MSLTPIQSEHPATTQSCVVRHTILRTLAILLLLLLSQPTCGQGEVAEGQSILDIDAFDLITLKPESGGESVRVDTRSFPDRVVPSNPPGDSELEVILLIYPDRKYRVYWRDIAKVKLYEQMILDAANALLDKGEYANAFEHLNFLIQNYPNTPLLNSTRQRFLMQSAIGLYKANNLPQALAVFEEIKRSEPTLEPKKVETAISRIAAQLIQLYYDQGKLKIAQQLVARLKADYKDQIAAVPEWEEKFRTMASKYFDEAKSLLGDKKYHEARLAALKTLDVDPNYPQGVQLLDDIQRAHPTLRVAVFETTDKPDPTSLTDWPARRIGSLVTRSLFEFQNTGPEGGKYEFILGKADTSDDQTALILNLSKNALSNPELPDAYEIAQWMLKKSSPSEPIYDAAWAALFKKVEVEGRDYLEASFRQSHVLPIALLQWPVEQSKPGQEIKPQGAYRLGVESNDDLQGHQKVFVWNKDTPPAAGQAIDVIEQQFEKPYDAIISLLNGNIDVIDRVFPSDAKLLAKDKRIRVEKYALPIVHMLVPKGKNKFLTSVTFRRGLLAAIDREGILQGPLLGGPITPESRPISGPFPVGADTNDPLSYAYNEKIGVQPYNLNLAKLLVESTKRRFASNSERTHEPVPEMTELTIGVPNFEAARVACEEFVQQWARIGVPARTIILTDENAKEPVDLLYVSAAMWEPAIDAVRLMGEGGIAQSDDAFIVQALTSLRTARNWKQVRTACQDIHELVDAHLPILPLYQIGEAFAYRSQINGVPKRPVTLYQNINRWRLTDRAGAP